MISISYVVVLGQVEYRIERTNQSSLLNNSNLNITDELNIQQQQQEVIRQHTQEQQQQQQRGQSFEDYYIDRNPDDNPLLNK